MTEEVLLVLEQVVATRFVAPLREGGSLPGLVEADDFGIYVTKFRGAGQGIKVLVAEIVVAELARRLGFRVPDLKLVELDAIIGKYEADQEVQDLLTASVGLNLGLDFLPGAFGWDGGTELAADEAARIVWLDAFTANVDRSWRNPNLLRWHGQVWLIDHGAALYFHHSWPARSLEPARFAEQPYDTREHVLIHHCSSSDVRQAHQDLSAEVTADLLAEVLSQVPDEWLQTGPELPDPDSVRLAYLTYLAARLANAARWLPGSAGGAESP